MNGYASAYMGDFKGKSRTHASWLAERTDRIAPRKHIDVKLSDLKVVVTGDQAQAQFRQNYSSDTINNLSMKTLALQRVDGKWLIRQETSGR